MKIEVTKTERTMIVAALMFYAAQHLDGVSALGKCNIEQLAQRLGVADAANDGPEVAILSDTVFPRS